MSDKSLEAPAVTPPAVMSLKSLEAPTVKTSNRIGVILPIHA